jgi:hypothetical protein
LIAHRCSDTSRLRLFGFLLPEHGVDGMFIKGVLTVPTQSKFNIYLNQAVPAGNSLSVAWLVLD